MSQGRRANHCRMDKRDLIGVECSAVMVLCLTVKNTSTVFFWSSGSPLELLGCDNLGPSEGSTPLRASSSKSMRSTSPSPYVNNLNYVASAPTDVRDQHTYELAFERMLRQTFHEFSGALPNRAQTLVALPVAQLTHPTPLFSALRRIWK